MRRLLPLLILLIAAVGFLVLRATRPELPPAEARERVWRVEAHVLAAGSMHPTLVLYGRIEAPDRIRAAAPVGGRVLEIGVRDGDRVEPGTVLARLDPRDLEPRGAQVGIGEVGAHQPRRFEIGAHEARTDEGGDRGVHLVEAGAAEICAIEVRAREVGAAQIGADQIGSAQVCAGKIAPDQVGMAQVRTRAAGVGPDAAAIDLMDRFLFGLSAR